MEYASVWFRFHGSKQPLEGWVRMGLAAGGLQLHDGLGTLNSHGIICFSDFGEELIEFVRELCRSSSGHVLLLAASPSALPPRAIWRLLHAGASDVLVWNDGDTVTRQIQARLERWSVVDRLVEAAIIRAQLVGDSACWRSLVRKIIEAARFSRIPILLMGESGTGKEALARLAHFMDPSNGDEGDMRSTELVTLDCSTIVPDLSGSELFGHERGAFTGAVNARDGAFALANGGTLFLDEIGELPPMLQTQLLRAVQEGTYKRVGGNSWQTTSFRLVCATNRELNELVEQGKFRLDLYYRIAGWVFVTPPLRERREDILPLARHFLCVARNDEPLLEFSPPVQEYLLNRKYPGNVRELRQLVRRMAHLHAGPGPISIGDIPEGDRPTAGELQRAWPDEQFEKTIGVAVALGTNLREITKVTSEAAIRMAVQSEKGNLQRAARRLGVTDRALQLRRAAAKTGTEG